MPRVAAPPTVAPLLLWPEQQAIDAMERQRAQLKDRIAEMRPHSHRRVVMQARLEELTLQMLRAKVALRRAQR